MSATLISAWIIGFVIKAEPLPTGAIRLTLDNGQIGIVENPQNIELSYLLKPSKQDGFDNRGVAFKKNEQNIITELREARVRIAIHAEWRNSPPSNFDIKQVHRKNYLWITTIPTPSPYILSPELSDFAELSHVAEDATKNTKPIDMVMGDGSFEIIYIQYTQSAFKNSPNSFQPN